MHTKTALMLLLSIGLSSASCATDGTEASDPTELVGVASSALQDPNAPVYDRWGNLCNVPAIPPPSPQCVGTLSCPTAQTPPADCDLVRVTCPYCPAPPEPPPPEPEPEDELTDTEGGEDGCSEYFEEKQEKQEYMQAISAALDPFDSPWGGRPKKVRPIDIEVSAFLMVGGTQCELPGPVVQEPKQGWPGSKPCVNQQFAGEAPGLVRKAFGSPASQQWARPEVISALEAVGAEWARRYPSGPRLQIGDISQHQGGYFPPHKSHHVGVDVDIRLFRTDGQEGAVNLLTDGDLYDRDRTREAINVLRGYSGLPISMIILDDDVLIGEGATVPTYKPNPKKSTPPAKVHVRHMHVRFVVDAACQ